MTRTSLSLARIFQGDKKSEFHMFFFFGGVKKSFLVVLMLKWCLLNMKKWPDVTEILKQIDN